MTNITKSGRPKGSRNRTPEEKAKADQVRQDRIAARKAAPWVPTGRLKQVHDLLTMKDPGYTVAELAVQIGASEDATRMILRDLEKRGKVAKVPTYYKAQAL